MVVRVERQHPFEVLASEIGVPQAGVAQRQQVVAMHAVAPAEVLVEHQEVRERHREVVDRDVVVEMLAAVVDELLEDGRGIVLAGEGPQREALVEEQVGRLVVVVPGRGGFRGARAGALVLLSRAAMAEADDVAIAPHCPIGPIALAACLQVAACTPNLVIQEMSLGIHYDVGADLHTYLRDASVLTPREGVLPIPTGPGLGIELDEDAITEASQDPHRWRNPIWRLPDGSLAEW